MGEPPATFSSPSLGKVWTPARFFLLKKHSSAVRFSTQAMQITCSSPHTTKRNDRLLPIISFECAGWENRTPVRGLENRYFTIKLIPLLSALGTSSGPAHCPQKKIYAQPSKKSGLPQFFYSCNSLGQFVSFVPCIGIIVFYANTLSKSNTVFVRNLRVFRAFTTLSNIR